MRTRRSSSLLLPKLVITLCFTCFIWYQIRDTDASDDSNIILQLGAERADVHQAGNSSIKRQKQQENVETRTPGPEPSSYVRSFVTELNRIQKIHNEDIFGPLTENDVVFVIQVHNRWTYLEELIKSLSAVPGIDRALIIFSHDLYDDKGFIEQVPNMVHFAKMMQIFYPSAIQLEPNRFPGDDPKDCSRDTSPTKAKTIGCQNAAYPDLYGHYREGKFCQTKHHWWWKINRVMEALNVTLNHRGPFVFLEEDHYVAPDVLHVLRAMEAAQPKECPQCRMLVLGNYVNNFRYRDYGNIIETVKWASSKHNMGMVFYRELWQEIRDNCSGTFCRYDDYNWDWSLFRVSMSCLRQPLQAMVARTTRVFHVGDCGVHHKGKNCEQFRTMRSAKLVIASSGDYFFPKKFHYRKGLVRRSKMQRPNGGWGDIRDHQLCLHFLNETL